MLKTTTAGMFKAAAFALLALGASVLVALPAAAHSPLAVDQRGQPCIQIDCQIDQITNRCDFPVQLTHKCEGNNRSSCAVISADASSPAVENGVTIVAIPSAPGNWRQNILSANNFHPIDIRRKGGITPIDSDSKEAVRGYACAIHTDGSVTSAGIKWHTDEYGNSDLVCVHRHAEGVDHLDAIRAPSIECPGEFVKNWAAECLEYETKPLEELGSGTRLTNKCNCPVVVDACVGGHPCHDNDRRHTVLQPGESDESSPFPGKKITWAACFQDDKGSTDDSPKSDQNNLWTCNDVKTPCSKIEIQGDTAVATQFQALIREETAQATAEAPSAEGDSCKYANDNQCDEPRICAPGTDTSDCNRWKESQQAETGAKKGEQPDATEPEDSIATLRGTPPPSGTPTANALQKCGQGNGQLSANAIVNTEKISTKFHENWSCSWFHTETHLRFAVRMSDLNSTRWLIANGADVNAKDEDDWTPLHWAAENNANEIAELLLENGADVNVKGTLTNSTPSDFATGNPEMLDLLRAHGGKCNSHIEYC